MTYHDFREELWLNFELLHTTYGQAFETDVTKEELWSVYLESIPAEMNPIYRERRKFDCSCCRQFMNQIGGVVWIDDLQQIHTLWEFQVPDPGYQKVLDAVDACVRAHHITNIFLTPLKRIGTKQNRSMLEDGQIETYEHYFLEVPDSYLLHGGNTIESVQAQYRDSVQVFGRALAEISLDAIDSVLDLVHSNTLYKGTEWKGMLDSFRKYKVAYQALPDDRKNLYVWSLTGKAGGAVARIRNSAVGTLLVNVSEGMGLDVAVGKYEATVAPANYKRPKPIFTEKMVRDAEALIAQLGYMPSLARRYATLDDIRINNILFSNRDAARRIQGSVFDMLVSEAAPAKKFERLEEIPIEKFIHDVLPTAREIEAFVENRHEPNMVSLIAPVNPDAPSMFKWNNAFSWAYTGNITDSGIRENVKRAGGNIQGVLRFSIQWNDTAEYSRNDLDAHCIEPDRNEIYYRQKTSRKTGGALDVDIINPVKDQPAVENIVWSSKVKMIPGEYHFFVHQFTNRGGRDGFRAEIEFDGNIYQYDYRQELRQGEKVQVAVVTLNPDLSFTIREILPSTRASREIWGVKTMEFTPVSVIMYSPNYWDEQTGIGNRHYMFMLKDCVNPERPNGFYNEFLKDELTPHKRVFEALGSKLSVSEAQDQLSGLGFSSTLRNNLVVKVKGATERLMKIIF